MNKKHKIDQLFEKYKIKEPIPPEIRSQLNKSKKKVLINILGHGKKSFPVIITVSILLFVKKFGINLTLFKSAILAGISVIIITGAAAFSTVAVYNKFLTSNGIKQPIIDVPADKINNAEKFSSDKTIIRIPYEVGIMNIYSDEKSSAVSSKIMAGIIQSLIKSKNPDFAGFVSDSKSSNKAKKILTGSVLKLDNNYKITLKLVDFETTQILVYITETIEKEDDISIAAVSIARKILKKM
jgi:hypothetical protein